MPGIAYRFASRDARTAMPGSADTLRARVKRVEIIEYEKKGALVGALFFASRICLASGLVLNVCPAIFFRRLVAEEHVAVRCRAVALSRCSSLSGARSSGKQSDGSDQGGKNAFHGEAPLQCVGVRSDAIDGLKNSDSVFA